MVTCSRVEPRSDLRRPTPTTNAVVTIRQVDNPTAAHGVADFAPRRNEQAATLLQQSIANPRDIGARLKLSELYRELGFGAMSAFFQATAQVLRSETPQMDIPMNSRWACGDIGDTSVYTALEEIDTALFETRYDDARRIADDAIRSRPRACPLLVERALATAMLSVNNESNSVGTAEFEEALRTLLTADLEINLASHHASREWSYQVIASYFAARNDVPSAYLAELLAKRRMEERKAGGESVSEVASAQIDQMLSDLRQRLPKMK